MLDIWTRKMLLRLCKSLAAASLLLSNYCAPELRSEEPGLEISYFPEVVFKGKALTCHLKTAPPQTILVETNGNEFVQLPSSTDPFVEFTFFPKTSSRLSFSTNEFSLKWSFQLIEPGFKSPLTEKSGFLHQGETPVILLPEHLLPPALDRRWQTVGMVKGFLTSEKNALPSILTFLSEEGPLAQDLLTFFPNTSFEKVNPAESSWFRVHGYLTKHEAYSSTEFVVVEMDFYDLERGMSPQIWIMKWQFFLQHLNLLTGYRDGLLFGPLYTENTRKWQAVLDGSLKSLARSNGLRYVDRSIDAPIWQERLLNQLGKIYDLP